MSYVMRHGRLIEVETEPPQTAVKKSRRKPFKTQFVKVPEQWVAALSRTKSTSTWRLATVILTEDFKCKHTGGEIVLSSQVTRMPHTSRQRAARELVSLGLIQLETPRGKHAARVRVIRE